MSLYCASSVLVYQAMMHEKNQTQNTEAAETTAGHIEFIMRCMDNGRSNKVTRLLLHQAIMDVDRNGLATAKHFSWFKRYSNRAVDAGHYVPVLARSAVSRHSWMQPPMAGRLPLINAHNTKVMKTQQCCTAGSTNMCESCRKKMEADQAAGGGRNNTTTTTKAGGDLATKRRRLQSPAATEIPTIGAFKSHYGGAFVVLPRRAATVSPAPSDESFDEVESSVKAGHSSSSTGESGSRPSVSTQGSLSQLGISSLPAIIPLGVSHPSGEPMPKSQHPSANSFFPSVSLPDLWTASSASMVGNTALDEAATFMGMPSANTGQSIQAGVTLPMDASYLYAPLNEAVTSSFDEATIQAIVSGETASQMESTDPWTTFLQAGDFDSTDWSTIDNQP